MRVDRFDILISLGLLLVSAAIYAPTAQFEFLAFDDDRYVTRNALVQEGLSPDTIRRSFTEFHSSNWHPLTWISHALDVQLFGAAAGAHHAVSVGLHALAACLLFLVLRRMASPMNVSPLPVDLRTIALAGTVAALFATHPTHVESVAWIAERKDVLCALFWILTLGAYLRYIRSPSIGTYGVLLLAFAAALLSKPMAITLPLILLGLDAWPLGRWGDPSQPTAPGRTRLRSSRSAVARPGESKPRARALLNQRVSCWCRRRRPRPAPVRLRFPTGPTHTQGFSATILQFKSAILAFSASVQA